MLVQELRPGTRRRISLNAEAWTLCRASLCRSDRGDACVVTAGFPDRSLSSEKLNPARAGTRCEYGTCSLNMVVKLQPEIHNHACLAPRRSTDLVVSQQLRQSGRVGAATLARLFFCTDLKRRLQPPLRATGNSTSARAGPAPAHAIGHRLAAAINCLRAFPRDGREPIPRPPRPSKRCA